MTDSDSAPFLRAIYAIVFIGIAAAVLGGTWPELGHLAMALGRPYHFGAPPQPLPLAAALLAIVGIAGIVWAFVKRRQVPLPVSALVLLAAVAAFFGLRGDPPPGRSWAAADKEILQTASGVQKHMVDALQQQGEITRDAAAWEAALAKSHQAASPARTRTFSRLPYRVVMVDDPKAVPQPLVPGTLLVWVSEDQVAFEVRPVGFDTGGEVAVLTDDKGEPLVLTGTYNPNMRPATPPPNLPALRPLPGVGSAPPPSPQ